MQKPLTEKRLENIALFYLERFDASCEKLRQVLQRRVLRQKMQGIEVNLEIPNWIDQVIQKMQNLGYVNDNRYAENAVRRLSQQGKSARYIRQKLKTEGLSDSLINQYVAGQDDLARAKIFVQKKHLGQTEKDLAKLARVGFDYETAKKALCQQETEDV